MSSENGGPAFPRPYSEKFSDERHQAQTGMTLRDYFAAKALNGLCSDGKMIAGANGVASKGGVGPCVLLARKSYELADAMLAARKEPR